MRYFARHGENIIVSVRRTNASRQLEQPLERDLIDDETRKHVHFMGLLSHGDMSAVHPTLVTPMSLGLLSAIEHAHHAHQTSYLLVNCWSDDDEHVAQE
jgi:hypothetical protein